RHSPDPSARRRRSGCREHDRLRGGGRGGLVLLPPVEKADCGAMIHVLAALAVAIAPGDRAVVGVPVATLWAEPRYARPLPRTLSTTERRALVGRIETQALLNEPVQVLEVRGAWARVAVL